VSARRRSFASPCRISTDKTDKEGSVLKETTGKISRERFIRLAAALGMSIVGASALAACGGDSAGRSANGASEENKNAATAAGGKARAGGREIAQISRVPAGSAVAFEDSDSPAVLVHLQNGKFVAYSAVCTHQGCTVAYQDGQLAVPATARSSTRPEGERLSTALPHPPYLGYR
jgi:hypothetical protein